MMVEYREEILAKIKAAYKKFATAKERSVKYTASDQPTKASEWTGKMKSAERDLNLAFGQLPEVRLAQVDMDAIEFAKSLLEPRAPKVLPGQRDFLGE